jgi:NAD(P)H dehydrogenase (quinone)
MTRILILGSTGNLGRLTSARLIENYPQAIVRLASSRPDGVETLRQRHPTAEVVLADWHDKDSLVRAMQDVDRVFVVVPDFFTNEAVVSPNIIAAARSAKSIKLILRLIALPPGLKTADLSPEVMATQCGAAIHGVAKDLLDASGLPVAYLDVACWIMFNVPWFLAEEIKTHRRLAMPSQADAPRRWVSEEDVATVAAKILTDENVQAHVGQEYLMTGATQYDFSQVAALISKVLGEKVEYVDDDQALRRTMGDLYDKTMTYFSHETRDYRNVPASDALQKLTGKRQTTLAEYLEQNRSLFI